jgi:hypothetical protein
MLGLFSSSRKALAMVLPIDGRAQVRGRQDLPLSMSTGPRSTRWREVPRYIRFVEQMPMTVTGQAQTFAMRQQMIDELKPSIARTA